MKKRLLLLTFLALAGAAQLPAHDFAKRMHGNGTEVTDSIWYNIISETPAEVAVTFRGERYNTFSGEYDGLVIIPSSVTHEGKDYTVTTIGEDAFSGCSGITELTVPETVDSITDNFSGLSNLTTLNWYPAQPIKSSSFTGWSASLANTKIKEVRFRHYVPKEMCQRCNNLSRVTFDATMDSIAESAFRDVPTNFRIDFSPSMKRLVIGANAFHSSQIDSIALPDSITELTIYRAAFYTSHIARFSFPDSADVILDAEEWGIAASEGTFEDCDSLRSITIPRGTISLTANTFNGCDSLKSLLWLASDYFITEGNAPSTNGRETAIFRNTPLESVSIGKEVSRLPLLYGNPDGKTCLTDIVYNAVSASSGQLCDEAGRVASVTAIAFGDEVKSIPAEAFYHFRNIGEITLPASVRTLGCNAFFPTTKINGLQGYTVNLDRESCNQWEKVYLYAIYYDNDGDIEPLGKFPGTEITVEKEGLLTYTFPIEFCDGIYIRFSDGTTANRTCEILMDKDNRIYSLSKQTGDNILPTEMRPDGELPVDNGKFIVRLSDNPLPEALAVTLVKPQTEATLWEKAYVQYQTADNNTTYSEPMTPADNGLSFTYTFGAGEEIVYIRFANYTENDGSQSDNWRVSTPINVNASSDNNGYGVLYPMICTLQDGDYDPYVSFNSGVQLHIETITPDYGTVAHFAPFDFETQYAPYGNTIFGIGLETISTGGVGDSGSGWAVSPVIDAAAAAHLTLNFDHSFMDINSVQAIDDISTYCNLLATADGYKWDTVEINWPEYGAGAEVGRKASVSVSLDRWKGEQSRVAFAYRFTADIDPGWEIGAVHITSAPTSDPDTGGEVTAVDTEFPVSADHFYDIDGDGLMEYFVSGERLNDGYDNTKVYDLYGRFRASLPLDGTLVSIDNTDRTGAPELIGMRDYFESSRLTVSSTDGAQLMGFTPPYSFFGTQFIQLFDADGDGRNDIYVHYREDFNDDTGVHSIFYQQPDGTFLERRIEPVTDPEEISEAMFAQYGANPIIQPPLNMSGAALAKAPRPPHMNAPAADGGRVQRIAAPVLTDGAVTSMDINMDGLPDLLNLFNGNALLSLGDNRYYYGDFGGSVTAMDVSGDGIPDYIVYDEEDKEVRLIIYKGDNDFEDQSLVQNFNITGIYCHDFDGDGDIDILLPFDYTDDSGFSYLIYFENDNNTFRRRENNLKDADGNPLVAKFLGCNDFDNDGTFELVAAVSRSAREADGTYTCSPGLSLIECTPDFKYTVAEEPLFEGNPVTGSNSPCGEYSVSGFRFLSGDFNNDGLTEFWFTADGLTYRGTFATAEANAAPERMDAPSFVEDAASGTLRIEWKAGSDATARPCDLSYALRIGTEPGKGDIWYAHSSADGKRLRTGIGNAAYNLFQIVNTSTWITGDYYISVQAVDPQGRGGEWSEAVVYTKKVMGAALTLSPERLSTADTLTVALGLPYSREFSNEWDFGDGAVVVSQDSTSARVVYTSSGTREVTLSVSDSEGRKASASASVEVFAVKMKAETNVSYNVSYHGTPFDADLDGDLDLAGFRHAGATNDDNAYTDGMLINDGNGTFYRAEGMYNADLRFHEGRGFVALGFATDFNMDGLPDIMSETNKGNLLLNAGDTYFDIYTHDVTLPGAVNFIYNAFYEQANHMDINGDGLMDYVNMGNNVAYINSGDNLTFSSIPLGTRYTDDILAMADLNNDGYIDMIAGGYADNTATLKIALNNGDGSFGQFAELSSSRRTGSSYGVVHVADFNNDGYKDILIPGNEDEDAPASLLLGDADCTFSVKTDLHDIPACEVATIFDFDNNGYPDILLSNYGSAADIFYVYPGLEMRRQSPSEAGLNGLSALEQPFGDLNGDGIPDWGNAFAHSRITNSAPAAPTNVRAVQDEEGVTLLWDDASDAETPVTQMRYNVSLRRAGKSGDGSYIVSPLNGGSDGAAMIPGYPYIGVTQMRLPVERFTAGEQYELKVQSIDLWGAHSPFSAAYTFDVGSVVAIDAPAETCLGSETLLTYTGTESGTPEWNLNGATILSQEGNTVTASWAEPGTKQISVTVNGVTNTRPVTVRESIDMDFTLPPLVLAGAEVPFTLPEVFSQAGVSVGVRTSDNQDMSGSSLTFTGNRPQKGSVADPDDKKIIVERRGSSLDARVTFNTTPGYGAWIELYCVDPVCGEVSYRQSVNLTAENITPEISIVTVDAASGHNRILWDVPSDLPAGLFTDMAVYREEGATDNFVEIGRVPVANGEFIDLQSDPTVRKNRYRLALVTTYGGFSTMSEPHSSVHVMLNRGMGSDINIIWSQYEGGTIEQYSIMRGTDAADMTVIATASGYETSYTDKTAAEGVTYYYALSYSNLYESDWRPMNAPAMAGAHYAPAAYASAGMAGQSNVVSTSESKTVTFAQSLSILTLEKLYELSPSVTSLHCYAEIMPAMATYRQVNWSITSGSNLATIDGSGMLTYIGNGENGSVTVKASTMDGSDISETRTISVRGFTKAVPVSSVNVTAPYTTLTPETRMVALSAEVLPTNATDRSVTWSVVSGSAIVSVDLYGNVSARGYNGTATIRATANDGSGAYGEITLTVTGFTGEIVPVESVRIIAPYTELTPENYGSVQLSAEVLPDNATDKTILWEVVSGAELIEISWSGLVRATGTDGTATVRATATDGSGAYDEITLTVSGFGNAVSTAGKERAILWPVPARDEVNVECDYEIARLEVLSLDGRTLITADCTAQIDISSLPVGLYMMRVTADNGTVELLRFTVTH